MPLDQQVQHGYLPNNPMGNVHNQVELDRKAMLYASSNNPMALDPRYLSTESGRASPTDLKRSEKMYAILKPNQMDPRASPTRDDQGAGISTHYGLNSVKNPSEALGNVPILA
jgi:hypothetical protein